MPRPLKVYRAVAGFHDVYVAATSRKAALEAWGADTDLFSAGIAEEVTDAKLKAEPLKVPGKVLKLSRGSKSEWSAAARAVLGRKRKRTQATKTLARAQADLAALERLHADERKALQLEKASLAKKETTLAQRQSAQIAKAIARIERMRE